MEKEKVYVLFQSDGYHPSVKAVYKDKAVAYAKQEEALNDEELQYSVFDKFYVRSFEVQ